MPARSARRDLMARVWWTTGLSRFADGWLHQNASGDIASCECRRVSCVAADAEWNAAVDEQVGIDARLCPTVQSASDALIT